MSPLLRPCNEIMAQKAACGPPHSIPLVSITQWAQPSQASLHRPFWLTFSSSIIFGLCANVIFSMRPPLTPLFKIKPSPPTLSLKETCSQRTQSLAEGQPGPKPPQGGLRSSAASCSSPCSRILCSGNFLRCAPGVARLTVLLQV